MTPEKLNELGPTSFDLPMTPRQAWAGGYALGRYHAARREAALREALRLFTENNVWAEDHADCVDGCPWSETRALLSEVPQ